jgi:hypothetical protein
MANRLGLKKGVEAEPTIPGDVSRLGRAWWILETARMTADVALKIAHYVTCFEGLFSTDSSELVHKLSERIAWFLGATPQERLSLFRTVKEAYAVRSKVVHGDKLSNKQFAGLRNVSDTCDDLLRRSLRKIMESNELRARFNGNPQELETFLLELVMGGTEGPFQFDTR